MPQGHNFMENDKLAWEMEQAWAKHLPGFANILEKFQFLKNMEDNLTFDPHLLTEEHFFNFQNCWKDYFKPISQWYDMGPNNDGVLPQKVNLIDDKPVSISYNWAYQLVEEEGQYFLKKITKKGCIFMRQTHDYRDNLRIIQIVKDKYLDKPMPVITLEKLAKPKLSKKKYDNTRALVDNFYFGKPQAQEFLDYYTHPENLLCEDKKPKNNEVSSSSILKLMRHVSDLGQRAEGKLVHVRSRRSKAECNGDKQIILLKKGKKRGVPYEETINYSPSDWKEIYKLKKTSLRSITKAHGCPNTDRRELKDLQDWFKDHLKKCHDWSNFHIGEN
jgi:hypothetical protein